MMIPLPYLAMCPESRLLAVAGASDCQVLVYKFRKQEVLAETAVLEIPIIWDVDDGGTCQWRGLRFLQGGGHED
jgi:hypothetical protein